LKTKFTSLFLGLVLTFLLVSFSDPYLKKRITDKQFKYEFYTTHKKVNPKSDVIYYWFKGGAIHTSEEGIAGELLDDQFDKFYLNNQLAEKGTFKKGKKVGVWRTWHPNGVLATEEEWAGGQKNGNYISYSDDGVLLIKGLFRSDKKEGKWINYFSNDTIVYRNDLVVKPKENKKNKSKEENEERKEISKPSKEVTPKKVLSTTNGKKDFDEDEEDFDEEPVEKTTTKATAKSNTSIKKNEVKKATNPKEEVNKNLKKEVKTEKKEGFFKRLFSKKDKTKPTNAKGS
jgi:antitoxin component YwqK of YwqJK toxin-antitoxin module